MEQKISKRLHVVIGVILKDHMVCIAKRRDAAHLGGLWEFPGGKVESGESAKQALIRELNEETGIVVAAAQPIMQLPYDYPERHVLLDFWQVTQYEGEPHGREGQQVEWVAIADLLKYHFPHANHEIVKLLLAGKIL